MQRYDTTICGRSMRWYEWLLALLLLALAGGVRAGQVYKCTGSDGAVAYRDVPCASGVQSSVEIAPAPPPAASPEYALPPGASHAAHGRTGRGGRAEHHVDSYECRVSNGDVFYRHSPCPHTIAAPRKPGAPTGAVAQKLSVVSREVSRDEACAQIHRSGAIGRRGHEHDEDVSTYDRNLGRDPCR